MKVGRMSGLSVEVISREKRKREAKIKDCGSAIEVTVVKQNKTKQMLKESPVPKSCKIQCARRLPDMSVLKLLVFFTSRHLVHCWSGKQITGVKVEVDREEIIVMGTENSSEKFGRAFCLAVEGQRQNTTNC